MEGERSGRVVCVTGGSGFLGSWLVMRLLDQGYSVNTTVRSHPAENQRDLSYLTSLPGATERLKIFTADLSNPDSFNAAVEGCIGVFHVATPVDFQDQEPEQVVTKRSIDGALGILKACLNAKTVKRVVYTSSASAVVFGSGNDVEEVDESFWSDVDYIKANISYGGSYMISKTLTEKAVLEFSEKYGLDVVTVIPSFVVGPFICPKLPGSVHSALALVFGNLDKLSFHINTPMVHVDDVARAHIFLFEHHNAKGRYNCSSHVITLVQMAEFLSAKYPEFQIPSVSYLREVKGEKAPGLSSKKLLDSGFRFKYGVDEMLIDAIQCCKEKHYL
ncbi:vestitone reductase-like [Pyrus ussuriensis x Pyrus communis]|uniref:Vestitone reductase-like n=1 Tax=Pyrus ussuriensis x Pyrus communis TaxID=2448454 RepID=A0A5N5HSD8_9ROSA|nr:vestitone reductase-like [Pyrus ussuriensis x Pyrus communis]